MADAVRETPLMPLVDWLKPLGPASRFVLHADGAARTAAARAWPAPLAEQACRAGVHGSRASLWLGPDEYLLLDSDPTAAPAIAAGIAAALGDTPHALVDVSHRQTAFEIRGPLAERILRGGCPLDLATEEFPVGACTRTIYAKADIILWRTGADAFHVEVWRSFSDYLTQLLGEVARDYV